MYRFHEADPAKRREICDWIMAQRPKSVALVAMGPSSREFFIEGVVLEGYKIETDEIWGINGGMIPFRHDRVFNMHDLRRTAQRLPRLGQAMMVHDRPILTTRAYDEFPTSYAFPLQQVIDAGRENYLNSTVAYAIAYAVFLGVKDIWLYGCDFWYKDLERREQGGQCAAYWLGRLQSFGIHFHLPHTSSLLDAHEAREYQNAAGERFVRRPFYGYEEGTWREDIQEYAHLGTPQNPRNAEDAGSVGPNGGAVGSHKPGAPGHWVHSGSPREADGDLGDMGPGGGVVLGQWRAHQSSGRAGVVLDGGGAPYAPGDQGLRTPDAGGGD